MTASEVLFKGLSGSGDQIQLGATVSSRSSFSVVARVTGPGLSKAASGCLAVSPAGRNPFHSALGRALSHDVYRSVTLALNQVGTHLPEEVWERRKQAED